MLQIEMQEMLANAEHGSRFEQTNACFKMLKRVSGVAGAYGPIVHALSQKLYNDVYSTSVTTGVSDTAGLGDGILQSNLTSPELTQSGIQRVPYYHLCETLQTTGATLRLEEALAAAREQLAKSEQEVQLLNRKNVKLREQLFQTQNETAQEREIAETAANDARQMASTLAQREVTWELARQSLQSDLDSVMQQNRDNAKLIQKLTMFGTNKDYPDEEDGEMQQLDRRMVPQAGARDGHVELLDGQAVHDYDVAAGAHLETQMGQILGQVLDDYEVSLSQCKYKLDMLRDSKVRPTSAAAQRKQQDAYHGEMALIEQTFQNNVRTLLSEQELLQQHVGALRLETQACGGAQAAEKPILQRTHDISLRRYGIVASVSTDDGHVFHPLPGVRMCQRCGAETVACPHQLVGMSGAVVVSLPKGTTHLRFAAPRLVLRSAFGPSDAEGAGKDNEDGLAEERRAERAKKQRRRDIQARGVEAYWLLSRDLFEVRGAVAPVLPRTLPVAKVSGFIQEMFAFRFEQELSSVAAGESLGCFADSFYGWLQQKYHARAISQRVAFEILSSLRAVERKEPLVQLFLQQMTGEHVALWKYVHLAQLYYTQADVELATGASRSVLARLYPSRSDEAMVQIELEQLAYSDGAAATLSGLLKHLLRTTVELLEPNYRLFLRLFRIAADQMTGADTAPAAKTDATVLIPFDTFEQTIARVLKHTSAETRAAQFLMAEQELIRRQTLRAAEDEDDEHAYLKLIGRAGLVPAAAQAGGVSGETSTLAYYYQHGFQRFIETQQQRWSLHGIPLEACAEIGAYLAVLQLYRHNWEVEEWGPLPWQNVELALAAGVTDDGATSGEGVSGESGSQGDEVAPSGDSAAAEPLGEVQPAAAEETEADDNSISRREIVIPPAEPVLPTIVGTALDPPLALDDPPTVLIVPEAPPLDD